jgi:RNA 3'-terminal phosphate cyclase (ATP)
VACATGDADSRVEITGATHVSAAPSAHELQRHWAPALVPLGLGVTVELRRAGFAPPGGGELHARVPRWTRPVADELRLDARGTLQAIRGLCVGARSRMDAARRQAEGARAHLWESRRLEADWEVVEVNAPSPGAFSMIELVFERSRAVFAAVGERRLRPETIGSRLAATTLGFLEGDAAVDPWLPDQIAVPLALGRGGGRVATSELTPWEVLGAFGCPAALDGRVGGPGLLVVPRW